MRNPARGLQQRLRRARAEGHDHFRIDHIQLTQQKRRARFDFIGLGQSIFRRAAFHDVADVNVFALQVPSLRSSASAIFPRAPRTASPACLRRALGLRPRKPDFAFGLPSAKTILFRALNAACTACIRQCLRESSAPNRFRFFPLSNSETTGAGGKITLGVAATFNGGAGGKTGLRGVLGNMSSGIAGAAIGF